MLESSRDEPWALMCLIPKSFTIVSWQVHSHYEHIKYIITAGACHSVSLDTNTLLHKKGLLSLILTLSSQALWDVIGPELVLHLTVVGKLRPQAVAHGIIKHQNRQGLLFSCNKKSGTWPDQSSCNCCNILSKQLLPYVRSWLFVATLQTTPKQQRFDYFLPCGA